MKKIIGYCRISRKEQSIDRQERNILAAYPDAKIVKEAYTGTKLDGRTGFEKILKTVRAGDVVVFDSVSRMSRNAAEGVQVYKDLFSRGVELVFLKEPGINTETYKAALERQSLDVVHTGDNAADELLNGISSALNRYMMRLAERQIIIAFEQAEKEVTDLHQRTSEGIETARRSGKQIGQKQGAKLKTKKSIAAKEIIKKHSRDFDGNLTDVECIKLCGISRNTFYAYKKQILEGNHEQ